MMIRRLHYIVLCAALVPFLTGHTVYADVYPQLDGFSSVGVVEVTWTDGVEYEVQIYSYASGSLEVMCEAVFPGGSGESAVPTLVLCHGGINGVTNRMRLKALELANDGYLVIMPSYRGENGSDGEIEVALGEVDDVLNCINLLRCNQSVDSSRLAVIGTSHGALIAALAASRDPEIPAVVCGYGVMDIVGWWYYLQDTGQYEEDDLSRRIYGGGPLDHPDEFAARSAIRVACIMEPPVMLVTGDSDTLVPVSQQEAMVDAFNRCGKTNYLYNKYTDAGHGFLWRHEGDIPRYGIEAVNLSLSAWDDILSFVHQCWESGESD